MFLQFIRYSRYGYEYEEAPVKRRLNVIDHTSAPSLPNKVKFINLGLLFKFLNLDHFETGSEAFFLQETPIHKVAYFSIPCIHTVLLCFSFC